MFNVIFILVPIQKLTLNIFTFACIQILLISFSTNVVTEPIPHLMIQMELMKESLTSWMEAHTGLKKYRSAKKSIFKQVIIYKYLKKLFISVLQF